jgi:plasmid stabilization system protein ParE
MRQIRHPLVERDIIGIAKHIVDVTQGDFSAARRRLDQIDDLLYAISQNPTSGARLSGDLEGWLVRFGGMDRKLTIVFKPNVGQEVLFIALVAFGGQDWKTLAEKRRL